MKKIFASMMVLVLLVSTVACGTPASSGTAAPSGAGEKTTIRWWASDPEAWCEGYRKIVEVYEEQNPSIDIEFSTYPGAMREKLKAAQAAGTAPDMYMEMVPRAGESLFLDLTPFMEADGFNPDEIYYQPYFDIWCKLDGATYALPRDIFSTVICYNKKLFDEAGVSYPQEGWTIDEFVETATKLTNVEKKQYGCLFTDDFYTYFPLIWSFGADQLSEDGSTADGYMNSPNMEKYYTFLNDLIHVRNIAPTPSQMNAFGSQDDAGGGTANMFEVGNIAMMPIERYAVGDYHSAGMDIGVVSFPVNEDGQQWVYGSMPSWSINKDTKHPQETWDFMKFAFGPEGSKIFAETGYFFPAVKSVAQELKLEEDPIDSVFLAQLGTENPTKMPFVWRRPIGWKGYYAPEIDTPWENAYDEIIISKKDMKTVMNETAATMDKNIADYRVQQGQAAK